MASAVKGFGRRVVLEADEAVSEVEPTVVNEYARPVGVDRAILNEAVDMTLSTADDEHKHVMRTLWSMDQDSDAAKAYFANMARKRVESVFSKVGRKKCTINAVLTQEERSKVVEYGRDFDITFTNSYEQDHAFFNARRVLDHVYLMAKYPPSMMRLDIGGSVKYHVEAENENVVVISPFDVDTKDPMRATLTRLALRKLQDDRGASAVARRMARSVLAGDGLYHRSETVQETCVQAPASIAVHVYDVPIEDWPDMMNRCGVKVHHGCMHFVNQVYTGVTEGEFDFGGARYEIDTEKDLFRMRVGRSSTAWYTHKWSDYLRYGANQIIQKEHGTYSYKIIERRQDTIFYRIVRVDGLTRPDFDQYYALPTVPMVEVRGFEVSPPEKPHGSTTAGRVPRTYLWPKPLWDSMMTYATGEIGRSGGLSYPKLFERYRTLTPAQSINSVHVSGGHKVPLTEVPALVVMVGSAAYSSALLLERSVRSRTDEVRVTRALKSETTLAKGLITFLDALKMAGCIAFYPFRTLGRVIDEVYMALMMDTIVTWQPRVRVVRISSAVMLDHKMLRYTPISEQQLDSVGYVSRDLVARMVDLSRADPDVAKSLLERCGDVVSPSVKDALNKSCGGTTVVDSDGGGMGDTVAQPKAKGLAPEKVSWYMRGDEVRVKRTVYAERPLEEVASRRRLAIQEALDETLIESDALVATCDRIARDITARGKPDETIMRNRREEMYNPDMWFVTNGHVGDSLLAPGSEFSYSGVFMLGVPRDKALVPVSEKLYDGPASATGSAVHRVHYVLPVSYTGYVLVIDNLKIFNGPAIAETLGMVLRMPDDVFSFKIIAHQGPPGCGKTTTIATYGSPFTDVFMAPTRVAKDGLIQRLAEKHDVSKSALPVRCRTLDSFLVNYIRLPERAKQGFSAEHCDEYVLARAGRWYAAAVLLGVPEVHMYGDSFQISHVSRVDVANFFVRVEPDVLEEEYRGYRNPALLLAAYNYVYDNKVRTVSRVDGQLQRLHNFDDVRFDADCLLLTMYQADKKYLNQIAQRSPHQRKPRVLTVHEAQGSTCRQVILFNSETRKRDPNDDFYLYNRQAYCLVAISRATHSFVYVKHANEPDLILEMMEKASDVRRVQAARDVATEGESNIDY